MSNVNSILRFISGQLSIVATENGDNHTQNIYNFESGELKSVLVINGTGGSSKTAYIVEDGQLKINATFNEPAVPSATSAFIMEDGQLKLCITETGSNSPTSPYLIENGQLKLSVSGISPTPGGDILP
jgi:hypothetical protein